MKFIKLTILVFLLFIFAFSYAQKPYWFEGFEGNSNTAPELAIFDNVNNTSWEVRGVITPAPITEGWGHSSFNAAGVYYSDNIDAWMITPRMLVRSGSKFSFGSGS